MRWHYASLAKLGEFLDWIIVGKKPKGNIYLATPALSWAFDPAHTKDMKLVSIESPYSGKVDLNLAYARRCMLDSISRGEAPFASHLMYPGVLNDNDAVERRLGMALSHFWRCKADLIAVYIDRGISYGMQEAIELAKHQNIKIEYRKLQDGSY